MTSTETVSFTVRMPREAVNALDRIARRERSSRNHELYVAARAHIDADKQRGK